MARTILIEVEPPSEWKTYRLPKALHDRLQELLDRQDLDGKLSNAERREAQALVDLVDMFSIMKLRAKHAGRRKVS